MHHTVSIKRPVFGPTKQPKRNASTIRLSKAAQRKIGKRKKG